jgi:hypothetical protein
LLYQFHSLRGVLFQLHLIVQFLRCHSLANEQIENSKHTNDSKMKNEWTPKPDTKFLKLSINFFCFSRHTSRLIGSGAGAGCTVVCSGDWNCVDGCGGCRVVWYGLSAGCEGW